MKTNVSISRVIIASIFWIFFLYLKEQTNCQRCTQSYTAQHAISDCELQTDSCNFTTAVFWTGAACWKLEVGVILITVTFSFLLLSAAAHT